MYFWYYEMKVKSFAFVIYKVYIPHITSFVSECLLIKLKKFENSPKLGVYETKLPSYSYICLIWHI